mgnify:FL=1
MGIGIWNTRRVGNILILTLELVTYKLCTHLVKKWVYPHVLEIRIIMYDKISCSQDNLRILFIHVFIKSLVMRSH